MNKLVRDKIPEIMTKQGKSPRVKILNDDVEYYDALQQKLLEEVDEFLETKNNDEAAMYEIADILEVIDAICVLKKYDENNILNKKLIKKQERGGFDKRLFIVLQEHNSPSKPLHTETRIGVYGICIQDKKVLMVKTQSGTKTIYNFPGGGVDDNEGFIDALKRECVEELGCMITIQQMICTSDRLYKHPDFDSNSIHLYYAMTIDSTIDTSIQEAQWFPIDKLPLDMMLEVDKSIVKFLG